MGTVHKFKRPPKNQQQFRGYRPQQPLRPDDRKSPRREVPAWLRSVIAWSALILLATVIWAASALRGTT
ncbi:hypothetical protein GCM10011494_36040 [Novosphingobium endophyticum]|uniref:Uncharacterized protein n=1 Tax=Novosphingobium endophyticum TaxID=1955250 RepID=A0A916TW39_9SPHN|nr:hypothetical protein GCM10011494_36040 [Novosphingobium endophyticum]